jgi:sugar lactone lactonase YvrE
MRTSARLAGLTVLVLAAASGCRDSVLRPLEVDPPELLLSWGEFGSEEGQFHQPIGLARGPDGSIYVTDAQHHRVQKFTPEGEFLAVLDQGRMQFPSGIAVGADGRVYVGDHTVRIHVFFPDGTYDRYLDYHAADTGLAVSADGTLLIAGFKILVRSPSLVAVGPRVWRVSPDGDEIASWTGPDDGLSSAWFPTGLTEDAHGRVYVTGSRQHRQGPDAVKTGEFVWMFDRRGNFVSRFGIEGAAAQHLGFEGVAVDSRGSVYVAEWRLGNVHKFSRGRDLIATWRQTGGNLPSMRAPVGILVDPSDRIYVADWSLNVILKFGYN